MKDLEGFVVATTRDGDPDDPLAELLRDEGAVVVDWPTLGFEGPADRGPLQRALGALESYDWIAFTSARAVDAVLASRARCPDALRVAAVGPATKRALEAGGWRADVTGAGGALALVRGWAGAYDLAGARVLFPAGSLAEATLEQELSERGARVERVEAYRTRPAPPDAHRVRADLERGVDVVTFASPSSVRALAACLDAVWPVALGECGFAAIGPTTRAALIDAGVPPGLVTSAPSPGLDGLVRAAVEAARRGRARAAEWAPGDSSVERGRTR